MKFVTNSSCPGTTIVRKRYHTVVIDGVSIVAVACRPVATSVLTSPTNHMHLALELRRAESRANALAEQAALRRVATAVAADNSPAMIYELAAKEIASYLGADLGLVLRFDGVGSRIVGQWSAGPPIADAVVPLLECGALTLVSVTAQPARVDDSVLPIAGGVFRASVAAPIMTTQGMWGAVLASTTRPEPLARGDEQRLMDFAELVGMSITNTADRMLLLELASKDSLTGLANHRTFHERLEREAARARRSGDGLCLMAIDVDGFKQINDRGGHHAGDRVLAALAGCLQRAARKEDVVARLGGDEFAWLLTNADIADARVAAERLRAAIGDLHTEHIAVSIGLCELAAAGDAEQLLRHADAALYWAKRHGGDMIGECAQSFGDPPSVGLVPAGSETANPREVRRS